MNKDLEFDMLFWNEGAEAYQILFESLHEEALAALEQHGVFDLLYESDSDEVEGEAIEPVRVSVQKTYAPATVFTDYGTGDPPLKPPYETTS